MDEKEIHPQAEGKNTRLFAAMMITNIVLLACVLVILAVLVPKTLKVINDSEEALAEARELTAYAQTSLENINVIIDSANTMVVDADQMVKEANQILVDNTEDMEAALDNFNSVDFETLNKAIGDLSAAVEPLARLSRMFGD